MRKPTYEIKDLSQTAVLDGLSPASAGDYVVRDKRVNGFGLRIGKLRKTWTAWAGEKGNPIKIGVYPDLTYQQAQDKAREWLGSDVPGYSPLTVEAAINQTIAVLKRPHGKRGLPARPKTIEGYEYLKKNLIEWAEKPIATITKEMIVTKHEELSERGLVLADGVMRGLSAVMNACEVEPNPVRVLKNRKLWYNAKKRGTAVEPHYLPQLYKGLLAIPNDLGRDLLLVCLYTGLRSGEARQLQWSRIDFKKRTLTIPGEIAKNGHTLVLPLTQQVKAILRTRQKLNAATYEKDDPRWGYVFPNTRRDGKKPYMDNCAFHVRKARASVRKGADDEGFTFSTHSLRHTFVTACAQARLPYERTKFLVNHRPADVTEGYMHLTTDDLRKDAQKVANWIDGTCKVSKSKFQKTFRSS
jgi:integrase